MKQMIKKVLEYETALLVVGFVFMLMVGGAYAMLLTGAVDDDKDSVADNVDVCPGTVADYSSDWGQNRYLWMPNNNDGVSEVEYFIVKDNGGSQVISEYTMAMTKGCSCMDILGERNGSDNSGQAKFGCSRGVIDNWIKKVNK